MSKIDKLNDLTYEFSMKYGILEERWVELHKQAQTTLDELGVIGIVPLDGLREWITKGLDESFERASDKLNADFDEVCKLYE
jgi:hypothetical protein